MFLECVYARTHIDAFIDGELSAEKEERIREHVAACASCASRVNTCIKVRGMLRDLSAPEVTEEEWDEMWHAIRREVDRRPNQRSFRPMPAHSAVRHWRYLVAAGVAAAILVFAFGLRWFLGDGSSPQQTAATYIDYHENAISDHVLLENHFYSAQAVAVSYEGR
jgi:anti-sigma factor RsiW